MTNHYYHPHLHGLTAAEFEAVEAAERADQRLREAQDAETEADLDVVDARAALDAASRDLAAGHWGADDAEDIAREVLAQMQHRAAAHAKRTAQYKRAADAALVALKRT